MERRPHPSDRRANRLFLTPKGRATLERFVPLGREISTAVLGSLTEAEATQLLDTLMRIKGNLRHMGASNGGEHEAHAIKRHVVGGRHAG